VADGASQILTALDQHLTGPARIRLMGGAALILGYGMPRATEDADLLMDQAEGQALIDEAGLDDAIQATNAQLEPLGLYITHLWGPEQQILTPAWRQNCRPIPGALPLRKIQLEVLGPLDLIVSKLCRADQQDMDDVAYVLRTEKLAPRAVRQAMREAIVPDFFLEVYPRNCAKVEALLPREG
jgi:uncharacterized nucleotidyltransferase DUF6036